MKTAMKTPEASVEMLLGQKYMLVFVCATQDSTLACRIGALPCHHRQIVSMPSMLLVNAPLCTLPLTSRTQRHQCTCSASAGARGQAALSSMRAQRSRSRSTHTARRPTNAVAHLAPTSTLPPLLPIDGMHFLVVLGACVKPDVTQTAMMTSTLSPTLPTGSSPAASWLAATHFVSHPAASTPSAMDDDQGT